LKCCIGYFCRHGTGPFKIHGRKRDGRTEKEQFIIQESLSFKDEETGAEYMALPSNKFEVTTLIDFNSKILGQQYATLETIDQFNTDVAPCRTFVFLHELEQLIEQNLIKGGDLDNAIVIVDRLMSQDELDLLAKKLGKPSVKVDKEGVLNTTKLQFSNEPARHKLLDVVGDLSLLGKSIVGKIVCKKPGHKSNVEFTRFLKRKFTEQNKLRNIPVYDPDKTPILDTIQIQKILPHRFPFLLVDKIIEMAPNYVIGVKNISFTDSCFQGHFPNNPVYPGVLQIEALAQTGGILAISTQEDPSGWDTYFVKIDQTKFKQKVLPGDSLIMKMELAAPIKRGIVQMNGTAYVGNKLVCEAVLTAQIVKRSESNHNE
ncbi:MAG TPA: bifunctional UDP-3-O-[3-hydroxymyristoyl] N-acetylglucosamine deacetylase/3-hydroxyacyl-ACP dehydratase, partial [Saprospiraceae bacterium]|nr:bifunctional UDP-3-O-[3-hydroxymyristoyl] N-acetylglucosamine deacetylase/3-hydroxyacyl-ACP dehydratase [Saprospiraceae bacterium]